MLQQHHMVDVIASDTNTTSSPSTTPRPRRASRRWKIVTAILVTIALICGGLADWAHTNPAFVPDAVDLARAVFGPELVAQVEEWVFRTEDRMRQLHYQATGAKSTVQWVAPATTLQPLRATPQRSPKAPDVTNPSLSHASTAALVPTSGPEDAAPATQDGSSNTGIWSPFMTTVSGQPVLERALVDPDPSRPYVQAALVRIDLHYAQLHLVAGTSEPHSNVRVARPGKIPVADQQLGRLLAAFNGGFKAVNGAYGMAVGGVTLLPPKDGLATLALLRDGSVRLSTWSKDMMTNTDVIAYRQNCPLLVADGNLTPQALSDNAALWGHTVGNKVATWRSGLGLSADGHYLIYVAGDDLTVPTLAHALIMAGADRAMQLDINSFWTRFVTFAPTNDGRLEAQKLTEGMAGDLHQFLAPDSRDFFYVTAR